MIGKGEINVKIVKYYCDCCEREVESENDLYKQNVLDNMIYTDDGSKAIIQYDICIDCLYDLSEKFFKYRHSKKNHK